MATSPILSLPFPATTDSPDMNYWGQQLTSALDSLLGAAWSSYTPTWTGFATAPTTTAKTIKIGRIVHYHIEAVLAAVPNAAVTVTLPYAPITPGGSVTAGMGSVDLRKLTGGVYMHGRAIYSSGSIVRVMAPASSTASNLLDVNATVPFTWAIGDFISISGTYESAA